MKKIVINRDFGGFGLCEKAFERYLELKGIEYDTSESKWAFTKETKLYWLKGRVDEDAAYLSDREIERDDPALVQVVEEMGDEANGYFANLKIVQIPDDVKWHIHDYDGLEHVAEDHRTWS